MENTTTFSRKTSVGRGERSSANIAIVEATAAQKQYETIKIAIDVHTALFVASRQLDNATPQPPQKFNRGQLLKFIGKQLSLAQRVVCCYEAGCFGFVLQREIAALGAECLVIAPQNWDERGKNVRTDNTDTMGMVQRLDRYVAGNLKALAVVRVPTLAEEVARSQVRQRDQFMADRNRLANRGKSVLMEYGLEASWSWWKANRWDNTCQTVSGQGEHAATIRQILENLRESLLKTSEILEALTAAQEKKQKAKRVQAKEAKANASAQRLHGIGDLSMAKIEAEIGDWNRFANRRQVASYTGLCPGVSGTGGKFTNLSVNKCGNRRLRAVLVELAWLLPRYQRGYLPLLQWKAVLSGTNRSAKKKAIVALARRLAVDLWRIATGKTTPEKLGLKLAA
jgi:transposase